MQDLQVCHVGRVEVRVGPSERWAPVCGDGWGVREGMVSGKCGNACCNMQICHFFRLTSYKTLSCPLQFRQKEEAHLIFIQLKISLSRNVTSATFHMRPSDSIKSALGSLSLPLRTIPSPLPKNPHRPTKANPSFFRMKGSQY